MPIRKTTEAIDMPFELKWTIEASEQYAALKKSAEEVSKHRASSRRSKSSRQEGLFKQVAKTINLLKQNPRHSGLCCHIYQGLQHPYDAGERVWEAYAQNKTPSAYRVFWGYGPERGWLTIIAITPHP